MRAKGRTLFTGTCSGCHKFGDIGRSEAGPPLNGMGAHGRAELLAHILDPNREVDPSFWQWNVTTSAARRSPASSPARTPRASTLRNAAGDVEVKKDDIVTRENTRRSLMPEGLEAMGAESLRDLLTFMVGGEQRFRVVDLRQAYTADSRRGFRREDERDETVALAEVRRRHRRRRAVLRHGSGQVAERRQPGRASRRPGPWQRGSTSSRCGSRSRRASPRRACTSSAASAAGRGRRAATRTRGTPVLKVTVQFADGTSQEHVLRNGEHFADAFAAADVPRVPMPAEFTRRGQVRYFALNLGKSAQLSRIVLESYDNDIVPATIAITAGTDPVPGATTGGSTAAPAQAQAGAPVQAPPAAPAPTQGPKEGGKGDGPLPETKPIVWAAGKTKVLIIGGGSSHDFGKFFGGTDRATLEAAGFSVNYTEDRDQAAAEIGRADVAVISVNRQFFDTPEYRKALFDFAAAGKGLVMLHPGTWYGFAQWPELNAAIVGGGARGHDRIAKFSVNAVKPEHPVMKGVPASFEVEDELYYLNAEPGKIPAGTAAIEVLAETSPSVRFKQPHPAVYITTHPRARIVGITLGHDERVHDLAAFKTLLVNAVKWAGRKLEYSEWIVCMRTSAASMPLSGTAPSPRCPRKSTRSIGTLRGSGSRSFRSVCTWRSSSPPTRPATIAHARPDGQLAAGRSDRRVAPLPVRAPLLAAGEGGHCSADSVRRQSLPAHHHAVAEPRAGRARRSRSLLGITAVGLMTLRQAGVDAFAAAPGKIHLSERARVAIAASGHAARAQGRLAGPVRVSPRHQEALDDHVRRERSRGATFTVINGQEIAAAAQTDKREYRSRDPRCIPGEGPIPVECRAASCGTCWVGVHRRRRKTLAGRRERRRQADEGVWLSRHRGRAADHPAGVSGQGLRRRLDRDSAVERDDREDYGA